MELQGRLYNVKILQSKKNTAFATFSVGLRKGFISCIAFRSSIIEELRKGMRAQSVKIAGELTANDYTNKNGMQVSSMQIQVWGLELIPMKKDAPNNDFTKAVVQDFGGVVNNNDAPISEDLDWVKEIDNDFQPIKQPTNPVVSKEEQEAIDEWSLDLPTKEEYEEQILERQKEFAKEQASNNQPSPIQKELKMWEEKVKTMKEKE